MAFGVGICARRCLSSSLPMLLASLLKADLYFLSNSTRKAGEGGQSIRIPTSTPGLRSLHSSAPCLALTYVHVVLAHRSHCQEQDLTVDAPRVQAGGHECEAGGAEPGRGRQPPRWEPHTSAGAGRWEGALASPTGALQPCAPH